MNVYVGNLSYDLSEEDLKNAFGEYGEVTSAKIVSDRYSGRSKGFGFIEMSSDDEAKAAIEGLSGKELAGRAIVVNEARPRR
ncbi:MAG: RNA-binding protein [Candidatus Marinimicrobia bacterium]|jgi:RNA recognition motif-containing protein|nr:RNA-binding protein [Candidatus Neomarinimicrobiota bacterium]|tara:strand:+ start:223 stop:468 length:246 start_codon:yes stop_codon:yes gene_type:complete